MLLIKSSSKILTNKNILVMNAKNLHNIKSIFPEISSFPSHIDTYEKLQKYSVENNEQFWSTVAKTRLEWFKEFDKVKSGDFSIQNSNVQWFLNGKLNATGLIL